MSEEQVTPTESATETPTETSGPPTSVESVAEPTRPEGLPEKLNILISSEETALYLAKKFGVPDNLIRDADERQQLIQMAQQMQQMQQQGELPNAATLGG